MMRRPVQVALLLFWGLLRSALQCTTDSQDRLPSSSDTDMNSPPNKDSSDSKTKKPHGDASSVEWKSITVSGGTKDITLHSLAIACVLVRLKSDVSVSLEIDLGEPHWVHNVTVEGNLNKSVEGLHVFVSPEGDERSNCKSGNDTFIGDNNCGGQEGRYIILEGQVCGSGGKLKLCKVDVWAVVKSACEDGSHNCDPNGGICKQTEDGGFVCHCDAGYDGDGVRCVSRRSGGGRENSNGMRGYQRKSNSQSPGKDLPLGFSLGLVGLSLLIYFVCCLIDSKGDQPDEGGGRDDRSTSPTETGPPDVNSV